MPVLFLSLDQVKAIHEEQIALHGGDGGIRDEGLLESAVAPPRAMFGGAYLHPGLADMAAAYLFHITSNHAFVDGNRRTALVAAYTFLVSNGVDLDISDDEMEQLVLGVAEGSLRKAAIASTFRQRMRATR